MAAGRLEAFRQSEASRVGLLQTLDLDEPTAESLILRAWEAKIISHLQLPAVLKEWRVPSHDAFGPRTRWSLFNAFTEILRPFSRSNPQALAGRTFRLNRLLVPPNESPAVIDATFQVTGRESQASEVREPLAAVLAERAHDPHWAVVDAFWANYQPGY